MRPTVRLHLLPIPNQFPKSAECFPKLRKIETGGFTTVNWLFTDSGVTIPNLQEFSYIDKHLHGSDEDVRRFFAATKSIKTISVQIGSYPSYDQRLCWAPNIDTLILAVTRNPRCLTPLCAPKIDKDTGSVFYICPYLRVVTVIGLSDSISPASFERFVDVRCRPINENGFTQTGCRAIEVLTVVSLADLKNLSTTDAWRTADVCKFSDSKYELRWPYRTEHVALVEEAEHLVEGAPGK